MIAGGSPLGIARADCFSERAMRAGLADLKIERSRSSASL
jgi:hypothetical protein